MDFLCLKEFMNDLTSWIIPGNSIVVYKDGQQVFSYQSGFSDLEKRVPMRGGELFNIYSCSKVATVTAALQLYERGKFLLDDPLYYYIPEFRNVNVRLSSGEIKKATRPITMRHLFTMTAGFDYNTHAPWRKKADALTGGKMDTLQVARCLAEDPLQFEPGSKWSYSLCHDVLAAAVEAISGEKFREYMQKHIFDPLDMKTACYHPTNDTFARMAEQYTYRINSDLDPIALQAASVHDVEGTIVNMGKNNYLVFGEEYDSGGAGITVSVEDYAKLANALSNGGVGATGEKILGSGTIDLLRTNQLNASIDSYNFDSWGTHIGHGYALGVQTMIDRAKSGSNGSLGEFCWGGAAGATIHVDPDRHLAYFYAHHMQNSYETYYQPRLRNAVYAAL